MVIVMIKDRYGCPLVDPKVMPTVKQSIMSWWLVNEMIKLGYPHNFQNERSDIRDYMYDISALIDKAIKIKESE